MKHPPYFLRPNKAVDRLMLVDILRRLERFNDISQYTYHGFGGPYLEEFRPLYELWPQLEMVSFEQEAETFKRQRFHLPCCTLRLEQSPFRSFLANYDPGDKRAIFWLDYTDFTYSELEEFQTLLGKVLPHSIIKLTFRADWHQFHNDEDSFRLEFEAVLPESSSPPLNAPGYAKLLQDMIQIAAQKALPACSGDVTFQPLASFYYKDGESMFSFTGIVCARSEVASITAHYRSWRFSNLGWSKPKRIDLPFLSTTERLYLQRFLPCSENAGKVIHEKLGYIIDRDRKTSARRLQQYADYHIYFPYFMKAVP